MFDVRKNICWSSVDWFCNIDNIIITYHWYDIHTCIYCFSGTAFGWGMGTSKQLATGDEDDVLEPTQPAGKQLDNR